LPYGVEGFATPRHLVKEDGKQAKVDEKLSFKVIEFNKDQKRIILSHSRTFEDVKEAEAETEAKEVEAAVEKINKKEKQTSTLGDIDVLSDLKDQMLTDAKEKMIEKEEKKAKKTTKKAEVKEAAEAAVETEAVVAEAVVEVATEPATEEKPKKTAAKKTTKKVKAEAVAEEKPKAKRTPKAKKEETAE